MTNDDTRILDRVRKLLAKAESTTDEEAESLTAKAADLMLKYELDESALRDHRPEESDRIVRRRREFRGVCDYAQRELFFALGRALGFKATYLNGHYVRIGNWIGFESDLDRAEVLLESLLIQQLRAGSRYRRQLPGYWSRHEKDVARRTFMIEFAYAIERRLREGRKQAATEMDEAVGPREGSAALALKTKDERVQEWYDERYGKRKGRRTAIQYDWNAGDAGAAAGRNADIGNGRLGARGMLGSGS